MSRMPKDRALTARKALDAAGKSREQIVLDGHGEDSVRELLADLMMCCKLYDVDFDYCLSLASDDFGDEQGRAEVLAAPIPSTNQT